MPGSATYPVRDAYPKPGRLQQSCAQLGKTLPKSSLRRSRITSSAGPTHPRPLPYG